MSSEEIETVDEIIAEEERQKARVKCIGLAFKLDKINRTLSGEMNPIDRLALESLYSDLRDEYEEAEKRAYP